MKSTVIFFVLSLSAAPAFAQSADPCQLVGLQPAPAANVASDAVRAFSVSDDNILKGLELSKERRLRVICEIKSAVLEKYALIQLKKERLNIDADQHMQDCARAEIAIDNGDRQEFLDRVQKCIAGFQDTHFGGYSRVQRPTVMTAVLATNLGGKILIARQSAQLIARIKAGDPDSFQDLEKVLAPGNEITKIDGVAAADAVAELLPYTMGSSLAFGKLLAANQYFVRTFHYPTQRTVALEIRDAQGALKHVELPWFAQLAPGNYDAQIKFKRLGLPLVNELQWKYDPALRKFEQDNGDLFTVGYNSKKPLFADQASLVTYNADSGQPGLRTGEVVVDRTHVFCYMQLLTFMSKKFTREGTKDGVDFFDPIEKFVASCESKGLPMIFDLKSNGGGRGDYPDKLLSILTQKNARYGASVSSFAATPAMVDLITQDIDPKDTGARNLDSGADLVTLLNALSDALGSGAKYTDVINNKDNVASDKVGGYSQKIVAIVTPGCISACDMMSRLLKNSGRAVLLGTAANGTGAGFESSGTQLNSEFTDTEGQLQFQIPNFLFGVATSPGLAQRIPFVQGKDLLMENRPTVADVQYELTAKDMATQAKPLGEAAITELFK
jgi:hypothetical protein